MLKKNKFEYDAIPKEGDYIATYIGFKRKGYKKTKSGTYEAGILNFKLKGGGIVGCYTLLVNWKNSMPRKLIEAVKEEHKATINLQELEGKIVAVRVIHNFDGVNFYANVIDIFSVNKIVEEAEDIDI